MNENDLLILNFEEVRRRSIKVWRSIPSDLLNWKPDDKAFTCAEMIRTAAVDPSNIGRLGCLMMTVFIFLTMDWLPENIVTSFNSTL